MATSKQQRIAACLIVRDAIGTIDKCLESIRASVHEINVVDTGSQDGTLELLARLSAEDASDGVAPVRLEREVWSDDFAEARNTSFAMASDEVEWLVWIDADDVLTSEVAFSDIVASAADATDGFVALYETEHDATGRATREVWRERIVRRSASFVWRGPVHESLVLATGRSPRWEVIDPAKAKWIHCPSSRLDTERNLRILRAHEADSRESGRQLDLRTVLHLGLELRWRGDFTSAIRYLEEYLERLPQGWSDERCAATHVLAACLRLQGDAERAVRSEQTAIRARPDWADLALGLTESSVALERWEDAERWARQAMSTTARPSILPRSPLKLNVIPPLRLVESLAIRGSFDEASAVLREACGGDMLRPEDVTGLEEALAVRSKGRVRMEVHRIAAHYDDDLHSLVRGMIAEAELRAESEETIGLHKAPTILPLSELQQQHPRLHGIERSIEQATEELHDAYIDYTTTVSSHDHAMSLEAASLLLVLCREFDPEAVLDLGSGFSSYVLRLYCGEAGRPVRCVSVDGDQVWLERTRAFLERLNVTPSELCTWSDFTSRTQEPFSLVVHDLGDLLVRANTLEVAFSATCPGGLLFLDDLHFRDYHRRVYAAISRHGATGFDIRPLTVDESGRYSLLVEVGPESASTKRSNFR